MPDSKRLKILKAITAHLEATEAYNLVGKVWRGRRNPGNESVKPFLVLFELMPDEDNRVDLQNKYAIWEIGVQGYIEPDSNHLTDTAHDLMAAVKTQLGKLADFGGGSTPGSYFMMGGLIADIEVDGGVVFAPDETTDACFFVLKLTLKISEDLGDLYE